MQRNKHLHRSLWTRLGWLLVAMAALAGALSTAYFEDRPAQLFHAVKQGKADEVARLVRVDPSLLCARVGGRERGSYPRPSDTPLVVAARMGHLQVVLVLLRAGAEVNESNSSRYTALHAAADSGCLEVAAALIDHGANMEAQDKAGHTPLHRAVMARSYPMAKLLLGRGAKVDTGNGIGLTPLHYAAISKQPGLVRLLLSHGADVRRRSRHGWTPIHCAAVVGDDKSVRMLFEKGADGSLRTTRAFLDIPPGMTALNIAVKRRHETTAAILRAHSPQP